MVIESQNDIMKSHSPALVLMLPLPLLSFQFIHPWSTEFRLNFFFTNEKLFSEENEVK